MPRKRPDERRQARNFGLMLLPILLVLGGAAYWRGHGRSAAALAGASIVAPILAFAAFPLWLRCFRVWMRLAEGLSWISTRVILSVFFFGVLTPFGLVARLFRSDPLDRDWKKRKPSYWIEKKPGAGTVERYEKQY